MGQFRKNWEPAQRRKSCTGAQIDKSVKIFAKVEEVQGTQEDGAAWAGKRFVQDQDRLEHLSIGGEVFKLRRLSRKSRFQ